MNVSNCSPHSTMGRALRLAGFISLLGLGTASALAQAPDATDPNGGRRRGGDRPDRGGQDGGDRGGRGNFSPEDMQARMLTALRERFGVTDDEEWNLIAKRLSAVTELRRSTGGGGGFFPGGGRGGPPPGGDTGGRGRGGPGGRGGNNAEAAALQAAVTDNLPEAEIKSRLERVREARRDNEAKLLKAQEDLRALLSVKQEAIAVLFGLLP